jgi:hypothetical protein
VRTRRCYAAHGGYTRKGEVQVQPDDLFGVEHHVPHFTRRVEMFVSSRSSPSSVRMRCTYASSRFIMHVRRPTLSPV